MQPEQFPQFQPQQPQPEKPRRISKKSLVITLVSIGAVLLIAGGTLFALWLAQPKSSDTDKNTDPTVVVPDLSKDYGACSLLTKNEIAAEFSDAATDLQDGYNSGRLFYDSEVEAQYCSYDFTSDPANGTFKAEVTVYKSQADSDAIEVLLAEDTTKEEITFNNGSAFYSSDVDQLAPNSPEIEHFVLTFFEGARQYTFSINQPADTTTFDDASAQTVLVTLAGAANIE